MEVEALKQIIQVMHSGVVVHDADGAIILANQAAANALGLTIEQIMGRTSIDPRWHVIHEDGSPFPGEHHPSMVTLASGEPQSGVVMGVHKPDGELRWLNVSSEPLYADDGSTFEGVVVTFIDITEQMVSRQALTESETDYRSLFNNLLDVYYRVDSDGVFTLLSPSVFDLLGYQEEELLGTKVADLYVDPDGRTKFIDALQAAGGNIKAYEAPLRHKDGSIVWVATSAGVRTTPSGEACCVEGTVRDISEKKRIEQELRSSEERYRQLTDYARDMISHHDAQGNYLYASPASKQLLGYEAEELVGHSAYEFFHPDDLRQIQESHNKVVNEESNVVTYRCRHKDGHYVWLETTSTFIKGENKALEIVTISRDVSERIEAEKELQTKQQKLNKAEEIAKLGSWEWYIKHDTLTWSDQAYRNYGFEPGEVEPNFELFSSRIHPDDRQQVLDKLGAAMELGDNFNFEFRVILADGSIHHLLSQGVVERDTEGQPLRMSGVGQDITERVEADAALRTSEKQFRNIVEFSPIPMAINTTAGEVELLNHKFVEIYGWTLDDFTHVEEWWPLAYPDPDYRDRVKTAWMHAVEESHTSGFEMAPQYWQVVCKDGVLREVEFRMTPIGNERHVIAMNDITDRLQAEEALRDSEKLFRAFFQYAPFGAVLSDSSGQVFRANSTILQMFGFSEEEFLTKHFRDYTVEEDIEPNLKLFNELIEGKRDSYQMEKRYRRKDGTIFWGNLAVSAIRDDHGGVTTIFSMVEDITGRIEGQREQQKLQHQLQQAQKMEAIGQLTGGIAHDFNNILASILGYSQMALDHLLPPGEEKLANALQEILRGGKRAEHLVAQMLDFSRGRPLEPEPTQVETVLSEVVEMASATIPSSIRIEQQLESNLPSVMANPVQLHQVLLNLIINARDAMEGKGVIRLEVSCGERAVTCCSCHETIHGEYLDIAVRDSAGILSQDVLERMFDPFFTTKPVGRGTGMGLSMVHGILHDWDGHVTVDLVPGESTVFHLLIPVHERGCEGKQQSSVNGAGEKAEHTVRTPGNGRILLVDDEETVARFLEELLKIHGYEVSTFNDSRKAVEAFSAAPDNYDLLLTDQTMPHMTGLELIAELHAIRQELPVILSSGYSDQVNEGNAEEFGIDIYLAKPVGSKQLFNALDALLPFGNEDET